MTYHMHYYSFPGENVFKESGRIESLEDAAEQAVNDYRDHNGAIWIYCYEEPPGGFVFVLRPAARHPSSGDFMDEERTGADLLARVKRKSVRGAFRDAYNSGRLGLNGVKGE